jgi:hypothetical protein
MGLFISFAQFLIGSFIFSPLIPNDRMSYGNCFIIQRYRLLLKLEAQCPDPWGNPMCCTNRTCKTEAKDMEGSTLTVVPISEGPQRSLAAVFPVGLSEGTWKAQNQVGE